LETIANEVHKPANKPRKYRKVNTSSINDIWSADIVDMQALEKQNEGYKYILTVIDIHSRYAWAMPLKSKSAKDTAEAFKTIIQQAEAIPNALWVDHGKEFLNKDVKKVMKDVNIYSTFGEAKAAYVERLNRTLKGMMYKQFTVQQNRRWLDILYDIVKKYNSRIHRSIGYTPNEIYKNNKQLSNDVQVLPKQKPKFTEGDRVRISYKRREEFDKAYYPNWTWEIFTVDTVNKTNPWTYKL
jgi:transposase InsO family protein